MTALLRSANFIIWLAAISVSSAGATLRSGPAAAGLRPSSAHHSGLREGGSTSDWPMYKHDACRSGVTDEPLTFPLQPQWVYVSPQPPRPAWPEPVKVINRLDFDYAPQLVVAAGLVCFGSSSDDTIRALDAASGAEKWHFIAGGPVRFAPQIAGGKVYFSADDGVIYCLDAATGKIVWTFNAAPADERLIGNERMISRWPARTGVLVDGGVLYCTAGMWPADGIFVYALDAASGKVIWCNDTSHITGDLRTLHMGADFGTYGVCPQGALLASGNILLVPTGKGLPAGYDRRTGKLLYYHMGAEYNQAGGTWNTIKGDKFYNTSAGVYALQTGVLSGGFAYNGMPTLARAGAGGIMTYPVYEKGRISVLPHMVSQQGKVLVRKAYELALAGETLLVGQDGAVVAEEKATQREVWRATVQGEARGIAVADGRVFVSTSEGVVHCFAPGGGKAAEAKQSNIQQPTPNTQHPTPTTVSLLRQAGMDRGFALVLGDADGQMSTALAAQTQLQVINALTDETQAAKLRENLLSKTTWYGSRIHVQHVSRIAALPFPPYFANCVLVAKPVAGLAAKELYRVLHPCGGLLLFPGCDRPEADRLAREAGAAGGEIQADVAGAFIRRGRLSGALDWDTPYAGDQRVRWPLRLAWFGGPGPALVLDRKEGNTMGPVANGRYFVAGPDCLTAVDAYNGAMLWTRPMPKTGRYVSLTDEKDTIAGVPPVTDRNVGWSIWADGENVYCQLSGHLRGTNTSQSCIQLNAHTGNQKKIFGTFEPPARVSLKTPQTWRLDVDTNHAGTVTLAATSAGLRATLTTRDPVVSALDQWELFFDLRPFEARYGLYERGVFQLKMFPARATNDVARWRAGAGEAHPRVAVTGKRTPDGTETSVLVPWKEIEIMAGGRPASFGFAAILDSSDATNNVSVARAYLFCDRSASALNNGWANIGLNESAAGSEGARLPSLVAGPFDAAPKRVQVRRGEARPGTDTRLHPFTGERGPKFFQAGTFGCGGSAYSATCVFMRSTALAIYDFADDSGMRHFDGIKPSCTVSMTAALGLLLSSEGRGGCECTTSFQTSLALAPVDERSNEDWAIFHDREAQTQVRQAAINFGAPGDRRDADGALWLRFPRITGGSGQSLVPEGASSLGIWRQNVPVGLPIPLQIEGNEGAGPHRVNADRTRIEGTDRPWIYASHYRGIRKATLKLEFTKPLVSLPAGGTINLDGQLTEPVWQGEPQAVLPSGKTSVFLRHDAENLYIAARRPAVVDAKGKVFPWTIWTTDPETDAFFRGDSFELFLGDATAGRVVHLAVNPAGARFDALATTSGVDRAWTGAWTSAVVADPAPGGTGTNGFTVELAIPWKMLAAAGLVRERLALNAMINTWDLTGGQGQRNEALVYLGTKGRTPCENFVPLGIGPPLAVRRFTVRLHFCELDDIVKAGRRVFDVKLQGQTVLKRFDIVKEAGAPRKALVKEFKGVPATEALTLEFVPAASVSKPESEPLLCALELVEEFGEGGRTDFRIRQSCKKKWPANRSAERLNGATRGRALRQTRPECYAQASRASAC
ncbi:MAG: PQQ-binding-like beta-propeller repeat protein [Lentisphaerae bacterium]|nr:PQQ-binding-like beta-propeller repeat protein [Lentisphaerota bacterium]